MKDRPAATGAPCRLPASIFLSNIFRWDRPETDGCPTRDIFGTVMRPSKEKQTCFSRSPSGRCPSQV